MPVRPVATYFADENALGLGKLLRREGRDDVLYPGHEDLPEVPLGTPDVVWMRMIAARDLVVLTRDRRIRTEQGIVRATLMGRNQVHELNREHVAAGAAVMLAGLRAELWKRFREELAKWRPRPLYAAVFGSAARGDGDEASDIDLLLVHPPFPGEKPTRVSPSMRVQIADALAQFAFATGEWDAAKKWESQVDLLRDRAEAWTGNALQVVDLAFHDWRHPSEQHRRLLDEVHRDGVELIKAIGMSLSVREAANG